MEEQNYIDFLYRGDGETVSCEDVLKYGEKKIFHDSLNKCSICNKNEFLFNGHDYKSFLDYQCCYECYVRFKEH